ncbi:hypothetical protein C8J56DRAFT_931076 [Mycena floridula]|nr:hypothetical protein C8J56DRAFT_931076 [Mycena floridula]
MQSYGHMPPMGERRDSLVDNNGAGSSSTPFQNHQSLGQALGNYTHQVQRFRVSPTPPPLHNNVQQQPPAGSHPSLHALAASPPLKRKLPDNGITQIPKRRREAEVEPEFEVDGNGPKHWTDEEKTKLFNWLMGHDEHWNSLRATKNSCLRECSGDVFAGKKTYQALKGCYERNFNLFKQIYAFESASPPTTNVAALSEADRLRQYESRLQIAKKSGFDVGNITARTVDHWHRVGWYDLFYRRWHGDPATIRTSSSRNSGSGIPNSAGLGDEDDDEGDFNETVLGHSMSHDRGHPPITFINQTQQQQQQQQQNPQASQPISPTSSTTMPSTAPSPATDPAVLTIAVTQNLAAAYLQFLQAQTQQGKAKLEYLKRRDEREEKESYQRREFERKRMERETAEFELNKQVVMLKQKTDRAMELISNPAAEASIKQVAGEYLKRLLTSD